MWTYLGGCYSAYHTDSLPASSCQPGRVATLGSKCSYPASSPHASPRRHTAAAEMAVAFHYRLRSQGSCSRTGVSLRATSWGAAAGFHLLHWSPDQPSASCENLTPFPRGCERGCVGWRADTSRWQLFLPEKTQNRNLVSTVSCFSFSLEKKGRKKGGRRQAFQGARGRSP